MYLVVAFKRDIHGRIAISDGPQMKKSLKNIDPKDLELLVSRDASKRHSLSLSTRARFHLALLFLGLIGFCSCLWMMLDTRTGEELARRLGMDTVAVVLENALSLLAYPFLMFCAILSAYAVQQLYMEYRKANHLGSRER